MPLKELGSLKFKYFLQAEVNHVSTAVRPKLSHLSKELPTRLGNRLNGGHDMGLHHRTACLFNKSVLSR